MNGTGLPWSNGKIINAVLFSEEKGFYLLRLLRQPGGTA